MNKTDKAVSKSEYEKASRKAELRMIREISSLLVSLKGDIDDDFRASEMDDDVPGMQVTVSTYDMQSWNYQTGDNSYSGGCYGDPHWSVIYLYRRSNCVELAKDAVNELAESAHNDEVMNADTLRQFARKH